MAVADVAPGNAADGTENTPPRLGKADIETYEGKDLSGQNDHIIFR